MTPEKKISGKNITLRDVETADASFILSLRLDEDKNKFLHAVDDDLNKQIQYIEKYKTVDDSWYFIIEDKNKERIGTVRIYDVQGDSFCWGSWIIVDGAGILTALESALLIYDYAFGPLGFKKSHFDVRKDNKKVISFHEKMGAVRTGESDIDYFYNYSVENYRKVRPKFAKTLKMDD